MSKKKPPLVIAVAARKGGVGKTTIAAGLASLLARSRDTLLIDFDPQSSAALALGLDPAAPGTGEALLGKPAEFQPVEKLERLQVLAGGPCLESPVFAARKPAEEVARLQAVAAGRAVVMDCPPGGGDFEDLAIAAAGVLLVVTEAHPLAVAGVGRVLENKRPGQRAAVVLNKYDKRRKLDRMAAEQLGQVLGVPVFVVPNDAKIAQAAAEGTPAALFKRGPALAALEELLAKVDK